MKILAACLCLVIAAGFAHAQAVPATKPTPPEKPVDPKAPAVKPSDKAKPADKAKTPAKKKEDPMGVIEGLTINRSNGRFLGLTMVEGKFKLTFYDNKKKPVTTDALRVIARWPNVHGPGNNQTILNGSGSVMSGAQFVRGPYSFNLTLILVLTEGDNAQTEVYTVPFRA